jgi:hypothetical protein
LKSSAIFMAAMDQVFYEMQQIQEIFFRLE